MLFGFVIMSSGQKSPNLLSLIILKFYLCMSNNLLAFLDLIEHSQPDSGQISFQNFEILSPKEKKKTYEKLGQRDIALLEINNSAM